MFEQLQELLGQLKDLRRRIARLETKEYPSSADFVALDGTTPLTADWDIGEDRAIALERIRARDNEGFAFYTDDVLARWQLTDDGTVVRYADAGGGTVNDHSSDIVQQPSSVTRLQTITVDIAIPSAVVQVYNTYIDIGLARNGNTAVYGWATGRITWQTPNTSINANILDYDISSDSSGTTTVTVSAITLGISFAFGGGDFLNTLDRNSISVRTYGHDATRPTVTVTIT